MSHPYTQVYLHLVWATWDRAPMLDPTLRRIVYSALHAECDVLGATPVAIGGTEDHVHMLVRMPTTISIGKLAQQLKGSTSHLANHLAGAKSLRWQGGYGVFSVSRRNVPAVTSYILHQEEHHAAGRLNAALESTPRG